MGNAGLTTAAVIRFSEDLEDNSTAFYNELATRWPEHKETLLDFSREGEKNKKQVVRTYQETVSDAYETSYSFEGLSLGDYAIDTTVAAGASFADGLEAAITLEDKACAFYLDMAERSEGLLATIPRAFTRVAKRRSKRKLKLETLLEEA